MSPLELNIPARVADVARTLVRNKYVADKVMAEHGAAMLAGSLHDAGYGPAEPWSFLHRLVPFMHTSETVGERFKAFVPTSNTLGCSWRWSARSLDDEVSLRLEKSLADGHSYANGAVNEASYFWVQPLGLIAPIEGKNRVDFFREKGVESFPAHVTTKSYPEPGRLKIYSATRNRGEQLWAVLDGQWLQKIVHPSWAVPLLEAYGVETCPWPNHFPDQTAVHLAFLEPSWGATPLGQPQVLENGIIDLHAVTAKLDRKDERVVAAVVDLDGVNVDPRVWIASAALAIIGMLTLVFAPESWVQVRLAAATALGGAIVLGFFPLLRRLEVPRGALKD